MTRHISELATRVALLIALLIGYSTPGFAQITAPAAAGPRTIVGVVTDTLGIPIPNADVRVGTNEKAARTNAGGTFRVNDLVPGIYRISARAIGYVSPAASVTVGAEGARVHIQMIRFGQAMDTRLTVASRGGLSGVIADTTLKALANVTVTVVGGNAKVKTDSLGKFYVPLKEGSYMLRIERDGFDRQVVGVAIPKEEGREIAVWLNPRSKSPDPVEGKNCSIPINA